jgi:hypothetical protein
MYQSILFQVVVFSVNLVINTEMHPYLAFEVVVSCVSLVGNCSRVLITLVIAKRNPCIIFEVAVSCVNLVRHCQKKPLPCIKSGSVSCEARTSLLKETPALSWKW